jgi:hypothetical protein
MENQDAEKLCYLLSHTAKHFYNLFDSMNPTVLFLAETVLNLLYECLQT